MHPLVQEQLPKILELCRKHRVKRLAMFGSALRDDFDPARSDIDLLVDFEPMDRREHAHAYLDLIVELEEALGRPADVVERHMVRNPYLKCAIDASHQVLYDAA